MVLLGASSLLGCSACAGGNMGGCWVVGPSLTVFPAPKPRSTDSVGNGTGRRLNCGWGYPHVGDGRIPGYWALSRVGTGMALTTAGLLDWASIGIMSFARVARRAASDLSRVDMELPASSVS